MVSLNAQSQDCNRECNFRDAARDVGGARVGTVSIFSGAHFIYWHDLGPVSDAGSDYRFIASVVIYYAR